MKASPLLSSLSLTFLLLLLILAPFTQVLPPKKINRSWVKAVHFRCGRNSSDAKVPILPYHSGCCSYGPLFWFLHHCFSYKRVKRNLGLFFVPVFLPKVRNENRLRKPWMFHSVGLTHLCYQPALDVCESVIPGIEIFCELFKVTTGSSHKIISVHMRRLGAPLSCFLLFLYTSCMFPKPIVSKYWIS